jgi:hypothetical protein
MSAATCPPLAVLTACTLRPGAVPHSPCEAAGPTSSGMNHMLRWMPAQSLYDAASSTNLLWSCRYTKRVCSLGAFSWYCGDELLAHGGSALLEKELVRILLPVLPAARQRSEIPRCTRCAAVGAIGFRVKGTVKALCMIFRCLLLLHDGGTYAVCDGSTVTS